MSTTTLHGLEIWVSLVRVPDVTERFALSSEEWRKSAIQAVPLQWRRDATRPWMKVHPWTRQKYMMQYFKSWLKTKSSWVPPVICLVVWFFKVQTYIYWSQCVKIVVDPLPTFTQTWIILLKCLYAYEKKINLKKTFTQTYMYHYHTSNKRPWINFLKISIKSLDSYALIELSLRISNFNMIHSRCFLYSQINEFVESKRVIHVYLSSSLLM